MTMPPVLDTPMLHEALASSASRRGGPADENAEPLMAAGTRVEVRKRLDGDWARGFEVVAASDDGYRVRRLSDGGELPLLFHDEDVRKEKKRGTWWY